MRIQVAAGVIVGLLGVVLSLQSFGVLSLGDVQQLWPTLVVGVGVSRVVEPTGRREGALLLVVGGLVQLSNLGVFAMPSTEVVRYWPLTIVLAGVWELALAPRVAGIVEGLVIACLGVWLQLSYFGVEHISSYRGWPLALVAVGGSMVWRGRAGKSRASDPA